jgi:hypothetical protein
MRATKVAFQGYYTRSVDTNRGWHVTNKARGKNDLGSRIIEVVEAPADQLLVAFFNNSGPFAGSTFDDLPDNPRNEFLCGRPSRR